MSRKGIFKRTGKHPYSIATTPCKSKKYKCSIKGERWGFAFNNARGGPNPSFARCNLYRYQLNSYITLFYSLYTVSYNISSDRIDGKDMLTVRKEIKTLINCKTIILNTFD